MLSKVGLRIYRRLPAPIQNRIKSYYLTNPVPVAGLDQSAFVAEFFPDTEAFERYGTEYDQLVEPLVAEGIDTHQRQTGGGGVGKLSNVASRSLYALVRCVTPETVIETGVCNGVSTVSILAALDRNDAGQLYSIDFPNHPSVPKEESPGWIVPDDLRERWDLRLGLSQRELPALLAELETVDVFVHDSNPSYPTRLFEFEAVWTYLNQRGAIVADDIDDNGSFDQFVADRATRAGVLAPGVGYIRKDDDRIPIDWVEEG